MSVSGHDVGQELGSYRIEAPRLKPSNALIVDEGRGEHVFLADFGLTKDMAAETAGTASDQLVGRVAYVAPERIGGAPADGRADTYSLACVLFECLTGEVPCSRDSDIAAIHASPMLLAALNVRSKPATEPSLIGCPSNAPDAGSSPDIGRTVSPSWTSPSRPSAFEPPPT